MMWDEYQKLDSDKRAGLSADALYLTFNIFVDGKMKYREIEEKNKELFEKSSIFEKYVFDHVTRPFVFDVSQAQLNLLFTETNKRFLIYYGRTTCPDCTYVDKNVLRDFKPSGNAIPFYRFDCDIIRAQDTTPEAPIWNAFKREHGISNVDYPKFGFDVGYVPTFQYIDTNLGVTPSEYVVDSAVYLNDSIGINLDGKVTIANSFYTKERLNVLGDWKNKVSLNILKDHILSPSEYNDNNGKFSFIREKAAALHDPLLKAFLEHYL